jgi:hypothetical protein
MSPKVVPKAHKRRQSGDLLEATVDRTMAYVLGVLLGAILIAALHG